MKLKLLFISAILFFNFSMAQTPVTDDTSNWQVSYLLTSSSTRLAYPFEVTYGPDNWLWITERHSDGSSNKGERIVRVNPTDGNKAPMIDLSSKVYYVNGQEGLLGMAIHPALYADITTTTNNYVFVAYSYNSGGGGVAALRLRIVRLIYDNATETLSPDTSLNANGTIIEGLPANTDHNAGRLKIGPDLKLYYTIGDQGANQFAYYCNPDLAQVLPSQAQINAQDYSDYTGKVLRLNLDGSIPTDNPMLNGVQSHIYSYGHRNPQGLVFAADGKIYSSEQMDKVDDEINIIDAGKNYGWPLITGYFDNSASGNSSYKYCNWSSSANCSSYGFATNTCAGDVTPLSEDASFPSGPPANFQEPIGTIGTTVSSEPTSTDYLSWPTVAPSSINIYEAGKIPNWGKSLFITSLKGATIYRAKLTSDGNGIVNEDKLPGLKPLAYEVFFKRNGATAANDDRYRDTAFDPDGVTLYAITDTNSATNKGVIVKIKYIGATLSVDDVSFNNFQIYPNPSKKGIVYVNLPDSTHDFTIEVVNILGQKIFQDKIVSGTQKYILNAANFKQGIYIVKLISEVGSSAKKLMIQ